MTKEEKNKRKALKQYEKRWVKPTVLTILIIGIPLLFLGFYIGSPMVKAMSEYNADIQEAWQVVRRNDPEKYFENTPKEGEHPIVSTKEELPNRPVLIAFYLQHCPYCEEAAPVIEDYRQQLQSKYPDQENAFVYVDVKSSLGQELIQEHNVSGASSMLLLTKNPENDTLISSGKVGEHNQPEAAEENIRQIIQQFDEELSTHNK